MSNRGCISGGGCPSCWSYIGGQTSKSKGRGEVELPQVVKKGKHVSNKELISCFLHARAFVTCVVAYSAAKFSRAQGTQSTHGMRTGVGS